MSFDLPLAPPPRPDAAPPEPEPPPEQAQAKPSLEPLLFITLIIVVVLAAAYGLRAWINEPPICDGKSFASESFGYCIDTPAGWVADADQTSAGTFDRFVLADGAAAMLVSAHQLDGSDVQGFADDIRAAAPKDAQLEDVQSVTVAGEPALQWDRTNPDGSVTTRAVVFTRGNIGWLVQFSDTTPAFDEHVDALTQLLDSWRFA